MTGETGRVSLRVNKFLLGESIANGAVAELRLEQSEGGTVDRKLARQSIVIPVGETAEPLRKELPIGHWSIDVIMPSGESIQDDFDVVAGGDIACDLRVEHSPHEEWSWHHLAGAVRSRERYYSASPVEPERESGVRQALDARHSLGLADWRKLLLKAGGSAIPSMGGVSLHDVAMAVQQAVAIGRGQEEEIRLNLMRSRDPRALWSQLLRPDVAADDWAFSIMDSVASEHRVLDDVYSVFHLTDQSVSYGERTWAYVQAFGERRLLSLPSPWPETDPSGGMHPRMDVLVRFVDEERGLAEVVIADDQVSTMLGYMTSNRLLHAASIAERAELWLFHKVMNRLAAAGGGYVMLATRLGEDDGEWYQWIRNLSEWFPDVPDGAILEGAMCLNGPKSMRDFDRAAECFREAYSRGLPYYSLGLSWLRSGLATLEAGYSELVEPAMLVSRVSRMAETSVPFTTLRLPSEST